MSSIKIMPLRFFLLSFSCFSSLLTVKPAVILLLAQSHFRIHLLVFRLKFLALFCRIEIVEQARALQRHHIDKRTCIFYFLIAFF